MQVSRRLNGENLAKASQPSKRPMQYDEICRNIRACIISCKGGVNIRAFERDYHELVGQRIPYRDFGHPDLYEFLKTVDGISVRKVGNDVTLGIIPNENNAHIAKLVAGQKSKKKTKSVKSNTKFNQSYRPPTYSYNSHSNYTQKFRNAKSASTTAPRPQSYTKPYNAGYTDNFKTSTTEKFNTNSYNSNRIQNNNQKPQISPPKTQTFSSQEIEKKSSFKKELVPKKEETLSDKKTDVVLTPLSQGRSSAQNRLEKLREPVLPNVPSSSDKELPKITEKVLPVPEVAISGDSISQLNSFTKRHNISEPVYKINIIKNNIYAAVQVNSQKYSSYPSDARNEDEAKNIAAKKALDALLEKMALENASLKVTTDKQLIQRRIAEILQEHYSGVFEHLMNYFYIQKYKENLPKNWIQYIEKGPINILTNQNETIISWSPQISVQIETNNAAITNLKLPPETENWPIFVTFIANTESIWGRLTDYSVEFESMATKMTEFYNKHVELVAKTVQPGNYYAYFEGEYWHRVKCEKYDKQTNLASIFFIDHGDRDDVNPKNLYTLSSEYLNVPAQAIRFSLYGLEDWSEFTDDIILQTIEKSLLENEELFVSIMSSMEHVKSVIFYHVENQNAVNVNETLLYELLQHCHSAEDCLTPYPSGIRIETTSMSHVTPDGDIYVNVHSDSYRYYKGFYNKLLINIPNPQNPHPLNSTNPQTYLDTNKLYFTNKIDGVTWHRAKILTKFNKLLPSVQETSVFLVDHGATINVPVKDLVLLENLSYILSEFPAQAAKIQLDNIPKETLCTMIDRFKELAVGKITTKVIKHCVVDLFIRVKENNMIASINKSLEVEQHLRKIESKNNNNNINGEKQIHSVTNSSGLTWPKLPPKGLKGTKRQLMPPTIPYDSADYFNVHVTSLVAHPSNFVVQPLGERKQFKDMCKALNNECEELKKYCVKVTTDVVKEGDVFAVYNEEHKWCRALVENNLQNGNVSLHLCDYGNKTLSRVNDLLPLKEEFLVLPYQALPARLKGVKPIHKDWSVDDIWYFKELITKKNFVSVIMGITIDKSTDQHVLELKLVDTSTQTDIYIDKKMIDDKHALPD